MLTMIKTARRYRRIWKILRAHNPDLTKDQFKLAVVHIDYLMEAAAKMEK